MDEQALLQAQALQRAGRYAEAIDAYRSLLDADPDAGSELANLATCLRHTGPARFHRR